MQIKLIFRKVQHVASSWKWEFWNSEAKKWPIKLILIVHLFTLVTLSATSIQVLEASNQLFQKYIPVEAVL